jgi:hypothetical protein
MLINLKTSGGVLEIDDATLADGSLQISIDQMPGCDGSGASFCVTKQETQSIVKHLLSVFDMLAVK